MRGLFITGSDTGVGKTTIAAGLARLFRRQGRNVRVCKPVATGATCIGGRWVSADTLALAEAVGESGAWQEITPFVFPEPIAPAVAARRAAFSLTLPQLVEAVERQSRADSVLLVEGVGGLLCPLTDDATVADLASILRLPLLVVTRRSLGTLNHTLLTVEAARTRGLALAGVLVNETERPDDLAAQTNVEELRRRLAVPVLAVVPFGAEVPAALAEVDWQRLAGEPAA
jgi:dethiobiotin synthetase